MDIIKRERLGVKMNKRSPKREPLQIEDKVPSVKTSNRVNSMYYNLASTLLIPLKVLYIVCLAITGSLLLLLENPLAGIQNYFGMSSVEFKIGLVILHVYALIAVLIANDPLSVYSGAKGMLFVAAAVSLTLIKKYEEQEVATGWYYVFSFISFISMGVAAITETGYISRMGYFAFSVIPFIMIFAPPYERFPSFFNFNIKGK